MARYTGPKDRLSRREGFDLFGKGAKLTRLTVPPGMHGPRGVGKLSLYGRQLREKQKTKRIYGIIERQFKNYVKRASRSSGNSGEVLLSFLERRLDNVVFRLGLAPTRMSARQLVSHGHIFVDNRRINIPSFEVKKDDIITLTPKAQKMPVIIQTLGEDNNLPEWLGREGNVGKILRLPKRDDIIEPIAEHSIIEFYSR